MNFVHDIDPGTSEEMNVIVEIPKGSHNKYELDEDLGIFYLDRANFSQAAYPCEYGFVPQTFSEDGKAIDVLVLATFPIHPGILVKVRPVAMMEMHDSGEEDYKIIGVPVEDKRWDDVQDLSDINPHTLKEIQHFFETYKHLKGADPEKYKVTIRTFKGKEDAIKLFEDSKALYQSKHGK